MSDTEVIENSKRTKKKIKSEDSFGTENLFKLILKIVTPTVIMMMFVGLYNVTDALIAAWIIPDNAELNLTIEEVISAGAFNSNLVSLSLIIATMVNVGAEVRYAMLLSKGKHDEAQKLMGSSFISTVTISTLVAIFLVTCSGPLSKVQNGGVGGDAVDQARMYTQIESIWVLFNAIYDLLLRFLRVEGKSAKAAIIGSFALPINILFDFIFMGLLGMDLRGAGWASVIAEAITIIVSFSYVFYLRNKNETNMFAKKSDFKFEWKYVSVAVAIGMPILFRSITQSIDNFAITSFSTQLSVPGNIATESGGVLITSSDGVQTEISSNEFYATTIAIYTEIYALMFLMMQGVVQGVGSIVSFNYGQKKYDRVRKATFIAFGYMIVLITSLAIIVSTQMEGVFNIFSIDNYPKEAYTYVSIVMLRVVIISITYIPFGFLISTKQTSQSYIFVFIESILIFFTISPIFLAIFKDNPNGYIYFGLSFSIGEILFAILLAPFFFKDINNIDEIAYQQKLHSLYDKEHGGNMTIDNSIALTYSHFIDNIKDYIYKIKHPTQKKKRIIERNEEIKELKKIRKELERNKK